MVFFLLGFAYGNVWKSLKRASVAFKIKMPLFRGNFVSAEREGLLS